jgi:hypothetical protein
VDRRLVWGLSSDKDSKICFGAQGRLFSNQLERFSVLPIFCIKNSMILIILDNYILVDEFALGYYYSPDSFIREVCANPKIVQFPSTPKEIRLARLKFKENEEVVHFTCNGKLNGANRLTIEFKTPDTNYGNFIRQWFEVCK